MLETNEYSWIKGTLKYKYVDTDSNKTESLGYHPNGKLKFRYFLVDNELNGACRIWDEEGRMLNEENYENDVLHGLSRAWHANGTLMSEVQYKKGLKEGVSKEWYDNGQLKCQQAFLWGIQHGPSFKWSAKGILLERYAYSVGLISGVVTKWNEDGTFKSKHIYARGALLPEKIQKVINAGELDAKFILSLKNATLRSICLEELSYGRFLSQMPHEIIHKEGDYELIRINWHEREEPISLVKVKCPSTDTFYTLRVPPSVNTVKKAIAWTFRMKDKEYLPEQET